MFITKRRLDKMLEDAKLEAIEKVLEERRNREQFNETHKYLLELDKRLCQLNERVTTLEQSVPIKAFTKN